MKAGTTAKNRHQLRLETLEERILLNGALLPDAFEPNDDFLTATALGTVTTTTVVTDLNIHSLSDWDFFEFTLDVAPEPFDFAEIRFDTTEGDLDLELYRAPNFFDFVDGSYSVTDNEAISLAQIGEKNS